MYRKAGFREAVGIEPIDCEAVSADDVHIVSSSCMSHCTFAARGEAPDLMGTRLPALRLHEQTVHIERLGCIDPSASYNSRLNRGDG